MKKISLFLYYFISFLFMEFFLKFLLKVSFFKLSTISLVIFALCTSLLFVVISKLFSEKVSKIICFSLIFILTVWFCAQFIVKDVFSFYVDLSLTATAGSQVTDKTFIGETIVQILKRSWAIIIYFVPFVLGLIFQRKINFAKAKPMKLIVLIVLLVLSVFAYRGSLYIGKNKNYSAYELFFDIDDNELNIENLGVINSFYLDAKRKIFGFEEEIVINNNNHKKEPKEKKYKYNNLDIDFDALLSNYSDARTKSMTEYFKNESGTLQNEYTGMFKGKNLIYIMAESFNEIAVSEELTPTLYKLIHTGFDFSNFYSSTIYSTIGGEMQLLTGLYPSAYGSFKSGNTTYPMGLATMFQNEGYKTYAYHDSTYTFQGRNKYLKALGFDNFKACGNGLEKMMSCVWLESDIEMVDATIGEYATNTDPFMVFYATVSGHGSWTWQSNKIAQKYKDLVVAKNYNYPENIEAYLASQIELDRALEELINKLESYGKLDDTVIVLGGDHYPYMLTESGNSAEINFFTNTMNKDLRVEINHSNLIIWNNKMTRVEVDKPAASFDVLPTVYNLFGLPYDSRLIIGKDILSTSEGLVLFSDRSWVSDKGTFNYGTNKFTPREGVVIDDEKAYIDEMKPIVDNKKIISEYLITNDYYKKVWNYVKETPKTETPDPNLNVE